ncbi:MULTISPECIES: V-type ATP synthase subunit F [Ruminococcus]|jgi:V/A-type H+-transporting ATPase subunit F|uniref:V/A-type H+-transporting ATPase subunit F n=1 Tax=Ruminococcus flavefaciens TaxID=1265 RepID=A0A315Y5L0_RUMFL|nr:MULTISPECIES: V-type ATP synthase subunit F [Ruminococcus]MBQ6251272.1 V-type ATP synthase subunit F [Ruminococcus sp.]MBR0511685.1 V-type ATP synthase subunit F [Ruminococcus sp.]MBR1430913.1 V-type ATP synthase subunit F [Ruminococcus sp.]MBR6995905.1 V-type ATP synthase subunit F [Ruminococcus sp.]PWJ15253.1 V/A-type H+-transporting ATPase subunit F [Ruminococcus flavefaciens]
MYKAAVIGDSASVSGFAALGLSVFRETEPDKITKLISRLAANDFAVIYITEPAAALVSDTIAKYRSSKLPSIVLIPAIEGNTGDGMRALHEAVEKAVGSDILN